MYLCREYSVTENPHTSGLTALRQDHGPTTCHLCRPGQVASPLCALGGRAIGQAKGTS